MGFIGFLLLILFIWFIVVPLLKVASLVNRARKGTRQGARGFQRTDNPDEPTPRKGGWSAPRRKRKRIDPSVGEYVNFQEKKLSSDEIEQRNRNNTRTRTTVTESQVEDAEWTEIK